MPVRLWVPKKPAIITRRALLVGSSALIASSLLRIRPAHAAVAFVQAGGLDDGSALTSYPWNPLAAPVGSGHAVVGVIAFGGSGTLTSVTDDKSNIYNHSGITIFSSNNCYTFWLGNITNGPQTITVNVTSNGSTFRGICAEYSGAVAASDPRDGIASQGQTTPGTGANAITSGTITTSHPNAVIWGGTLALSFQAQAAAGTGFTSRADAGVSQGIWSEDKAFASAGSTAATFTQAGGDGDVFTAAIGVTAFSGSRPHTFMMQGI